MPQITKSIFHSKIKKKKFKNLEDITPPKEIVLKENLTGISMKRKLSLIQQ